jgi:replication factor C subunit 1
LLDRGDGTGFGFILSETIKASIMDIRNFFGKKSSVTQTEKPKQPERKADAKLQPSPAVSTKLPSQGPAPSRVRARAPPKKKTKVILDDTDDSDATDCLVGESLPTRTGKSPGRTPKVVDTVVDKVTSKTAKSPFKRNLASSGHAISDSPKKKLRSTVDEGIIGVNSDDRKTSANDSRRSRAMVSIALDDDTTEEDERPSIKTPQSKRRMKKTRSSPLDDIDMDDDSNDDLPDTPKENSRGKRKAPSSTKKMTPAKKTPTKSTSKQAASAKKDQLLEPSLELASFETLNAAPECLSGLTFVFSGILNNLGRDESIDFVKELGGRVTTAVSSKTSYLVVGDLLEDGRPFSEGSKYKKAIEMGVKVIHGEGKFFGLCKLYSDKTNALESCESAVVAPAPTVTSPAPVLVAPAPAPRINPYAKKANPYAKANPPATNAALNPYASNAAASVLQMENKSAGDPNALWADKYAPVTTADILGNQDSVKKLKTCKLNVVYCIHCTGLDDA